VDNEPGRSREECRHCKASLHNRAFIRDALGQLCINCAKELGTAFD